MATLDKKVKQVLASRFTGAKISLTGFRRGKPIGGTVVWKGFEGEPQIDRQVEIRRTIDAALPTGEKDRVSFILTLTPEEYDAITESDDND